MSNFGDITIDDVYDKRDELIANRLVPQSGAIWLTDMADILRLVGLNVIELDGWQTRARSSGGFADWPLCVMWHHTASGISSDGWPDASYIANGDENSPISNLYIDRSGTVFVIAAGATNTNGKGKAITFSRGTVPADGMNTRALGIECGNNGVGENWPEAQINALFRTSIVMSLWFGNRVDDISSHNFYAPDRKIDPATDNVSGEWIPLIVNSSRSWDVQDMRNECVYRLNAFLNDNPPIPPHPSEDDLAIRIFESQSDPKEFNAVFYGYVDGQDRSIELQWTGNGDDPDVAARLQVMRENFETRHVSLSGILNNRLHPKHKPSDINDSLHTWTERDFAP
jgi:hypothetical protein